MAGGSGSGGRPPGSFSLWPAHLQGAASRQPFLKQCPLGCVFFWGVHTPVLRRAVAAIPNARCTLPAASALGTCASQSAVTRDHLAEPAERAVQRAATHQQPRLLGVAGSFVAAHKQPSALHYAVDGSAEPGARPAQGEARSPPPSRCSRAQPAHARSSSLQPPMCHSPDT